VCRSPTASATWQKMRTARKIQTNCSVWDTSQSHPHHPLPTLRDLYSRRGPTACSLSCKAHPPRPARQHGAKPSSLPFELRNLTNIQFLKERLGRKRQLFLCSPPSRTGLCTNRSCVRDTKEQLFCSKNIQAKCRLTESLNRIKSKTEQIQESRKFTFSK